MEKLFVYADFDWLKDIELVGELCYESLRASDSYAFKYAESWLHNHGEIFLSADINNYPGQQYTMPGKDIFGCFSDALPDRWGRTLLNRLEQISAQMENRPIRRLTSFDQLIGIADATRMGGFRFKSDPDSDFINQEATFSVPPIAQLRDLLTASQEVEKSEERNMLPEQKWIAQLVVPGSSLGGARPKASVIDTENSLHIAKFPSRKDDYDVALWEHLCHLLAKDAGINVAQTRVITLGERYHTLLSHRFDRTTEGRRVHFASALSLLGLTDGDNATTNHGYLDIVDFILQNCTDVEANLSELYRRVAFNISVGNSDDHFRNHGFLLTSKGWTLSPAYDINPTTSRYQSLLINANTNIADVNILLDSCEQYMLSRKNAEAIVEEVKASVRSWKAHARRLNIHQREIAMFQPVFEK